MWKFPALLFALVAVAFSSAFAQNSQSQSAPGATSPIPVRIDICEYTKVGNLEFHHCGVLTWDGQKYDSTFEPLIGPNGRPVDLPSVGEMTMTRTGNNITFDRHDSQGTEGSAHYSGTLSGDKRVTGDVTWRNHGVFHGTFTADLSFPSPPAHPDSQPAAVALSPSQPPAPEPRAVVPATHQRGTTMMDDVQSDLAPGNYYALVIGINDYGAPMPTLKTAVSDARSVAELLSGQYGFQVTILLNQDATRDNIFKVITHFRKSLAENDSFLIYYAGHGFFDRETAKAYWLPADADPDPLVTSRDISADDLTTEVRGLAARHVIIISDSCFAGDISRDAGDFSPSDGNQAYIHRMQRAPSRTLMASGSDEPVSDSGSRGHSVFADLLLQAMQSPREKSFTADDLFVSIRKSVLTRSGQSPQYTSLRDSIRSSSSLDMGDFVFNRKAAVGSLQAVPAN